MSLLYNTGDWFPRFNQGDTYRKVELYQLDWPVNTDLDQMFIVGSQFGGPVAAVRDRRYIDRSNPNAKPVIRIFSCSGNLISTINWNSGTFLTMGWSDREELLCVQDDGVVLRYDMFGKFLHSFTMGPEAKDCKVIDAQIFQGPDSTGVAVMTTNHRIYFISNYKEPKTKLLPDLPKSIANPTAWTIFTEDRSFVCFISREKELFRIVHGDTMALPQSIQLSHEYDRIVKICVSLNSAHVAFCTENGHIWMGSSDLRTKYCEFDTNRGKPPSDLQWCLDGTSSTNAVLLLTYPNLLLMINRDGEFHPCNYEQTVHLIPEIDCVRVLSNSYHEMIQKVPRCVADIFGFMSVPSMQLFEASRKFQERRHESNDYLALVGDKINEAVDDCIEAASFEFDPDTQKNLFRAAYFGKGFIPSHNPDFYVKMSRILRVLNNIRHPTVGIPITQKQFNCLTAKVLLDRLVARKYYGLAIQIAKHLNLGEARILEHWAFHQVVQARTDDFEVAKRIEHKFKYTNVQGISFCTIARKAQEAGKTKLAIMLLELEPRQALRVPLLLKLNESKKALLAATQSGDTDLVYTVVLQLKETTQLADFLMIIRSFPLAQNLYKKYCKTHNPSTLTDILTQEDDFFSQAEMVMREGNHSGQIDLPIAANLYKKSNKPVEAELCEETRRLQKLQKELEKKDRRFIGLSLHETVQQLLVIGDLKQAEKVKSDFKMPDRRYWWLRLHVMAQQNKWDDIEKFSKMKKSPIGYEPFVEIALDHAQVEEARKYLPRVRDENKVKLHMRAGLYKEAAFFAFEQKDRASLQNILKEVINRHNQEIQIEVENLIRKLSEM